MEEKSKKRKATGAWGRKVQPPSDVPDWKKRGGKRNGWKVTYRDKYFWDVLTADLEKSFEKYREDIKKAHDEGDLGEELRCRRRLRDAESELAWRKGVDDMRLRSRKLNLRDSFGKAYENALHLYGAMTDEAGKAFAEKLSEYYTGKFIWTSFDRHFSDNLKEDFRDKILECHIFNELWQVRWRIQSPVSSDRPAAYQNLRNSLEEFYLMIGGRDIDGVMLSPEDKHSEFIKVVFEHPQKPIELIEAELREIQEGEQDNAT